MSARRFNAGDLALVIGGEWPELLMTVVEVVEVLPPGTRARCPCCGAEAGADYLVAGDAVAVEAAKRGFGGAREICALDHQLAPLRGDPDAETDATDDELAEADAALVGGLR